MPHIEIIAILLNHVPIVYADPHHYRGVRDCMAKMYRTEGFLAFWKGRCQINQNCQQISAKNFLENVQMFSKNYRPFSAVPLLLSSCSSSESQLHWCSNGNAKRSEHL
jgi:hypothetical protein